MSKTNIISLIGVLILLGYVFLHSDFYGQSGDELVFAVVINDEGFYPNKLAVPLGSTITWVSEGERPHWPASNFHPNHTLYPEPGGCLGSTLDACRGLQKGESFSFTLNNAGIWPMHDHLSPGLIMTVEVLEKGEQVGEKKFIFNKKTPVADFRSFGYTEQLEFVKAMSVEDPMDAWAYIKEAFIVNGQVVGNAHEFAHIIGNNSYKKSGLRGIKICDKTFAFGCFHGVTEAMLLKEGPGKIEVIEQGCIDLFPATVSDDYTGCIHGTGHGIFTWEGGDLHKSLLDCDVLSDPYRPYCYDGVFMENATSLGNGAFDPKDPWKFCSDLHERYHRNCARYQSQVFLGTVSSSSLLKSVGINCALGSSNLLRETCYESLGYYVSQSSLGNVSEILKKCADMPNSEGVSICTTGAAIETVFQKYGNFKNSATTLCEQLIKSRQDYCFSNINRMLR